MKKLNFAFLLSLATGLAACAPQHSTKSNFENENSKVLKNRVLDTINEKGHVTFCSFLDFKREKAECVRKNFKALKSQCINRVEFKTLIEYNYVIFCTEDSEKSEATGFTACNGGSMELASFREHSESEIDQILNNLEAESNFLKFRTEFNQAEAQAFDFPDLG